MTSPGPEPRIRWVWGRIILLFVVFFTTVNLFAFGFMVLWGPDIDPETPPEALGLDALEPPVVLGLLAIQAVLGLVVTAILAPVVDRRPWRSLLGGPSPVGGAWGFAFGVILAALVLLSISAVAGRHLRWEGFGLGPGVTLSTLAVVLLSVVSEEVFFRGYVLVNLREALGDLRGVAFSALAFAAFHVSNPGATPLTAINVFLVGVVLAQLRMWTGSLAPAVGLHAGWNLALGMGFGAPVSGLELSSALRVSLTDLPGSLAGSDFGPEGSAVTTLVFTVVAVLLARRLTQSEPAGPAGMD